MSESSDSTREVLVEIGDRARGIVEELARQARVRAEQADSAAGDFGARDPGAVAGPEGSPLPPDLVRHLAELRACVGQVADVLEGAVERLETVESQLGEPEAGVEEQLRLGIARCEHLLLGIEHRVLRTAAVPGPGADAAPDGARDPGEVVTVLVVCPGSPRRARLCLALEGQGLRTLAAPDLRAARTLADRHRPEVALIWFDGEDPGDLLEEWKELVDRGALPRALVVLSGPQGPGREAGGDHWRDHERFNEDHGEAAMAARLTRMARGDRLQAGVAH